MRTLYLFIIACCFFFNCVRAQSYFPLPSITDTAQFNNGVSRTAALLFAANKNNPVEVRILVYGQSISVQTWWKDVKKFVETKFPYARINFVNKAIGGFSAERLKLTVENDVVPFYPDLVLFHDYGNEQDYEKIIQIIRSRTTAEIALQTDHMAVQSQEWHDKHSAEWLPSISKKYGLAIIDVRKTWKQYLQQNKLDIKDLLSDGVHLNAHGNYLMGSIVNKYFESLQPTEVKSAFVEEYLEDEHFTISGKVLKMHVNGNRVDLVLNERGDKARKIEVQVNGKEPQNLNNCYYYTRPTLDSTTFFLKKIGQPLAMRLIGDVMEEDWTMTINWVDSLTQQVGFSIRGSVTGNDGVGRSDSVFTSKSNTIVIDPSWWFRAKEFASFPWLVPGDELSWQVKSMCVNKLKTGAAQTTTVVQGIKNGRHRLKLKGKGVKKIKAVRVYTPSLK